MSVVIPTVLSPSRVSQALASVGAPAGSGGLRVSSNDPIPSGHSADAHKGVGATDLPSTGAAGAQPRTPSPSRMAATSLNGVGLPGATDAAAGPAHPTSAAAASAASTSTSGAGPGGGSTSARRPSSGVGGGDASSITTSARSLNTARRQLASGRSFHSRPDSPRTASGRVHLAPEASSTSVATAGRAYNANGSSTRRIGRDRSFAGSIAGGSVGHFRLPHGSMNGGYNAGLDTVSFQLGLLGGRGGGPTSLQPAPGTVGGIDVARLAAIQRLLEELDSDDGGGEQAAGGGGVGGGSPRGEDSSYRLRSGSFVEGGGEGESVRQRVSDSGSVAGSTSGLRTLVSLRSRRDMQHWQPSVSAMKGSLEEHQQRLRERADVTQSLKRWAEHVLEDARRAAGGAHGGRSEEIARAASVRFIGLPEEPPPPKPGEEFLDPEQELDDEEERRMEALMALPPNPRGLGAQLRSHFMAVVEEEVQRKFDLMRAKWEADKGHEADELRELRENYRELRRMHMETKDALDKANTRLDVMRLQMKASSAFNKAGREAAAAMAAAAAAGEGGDGSVSGGVPGVGTKHRGNRSSQHDSEGKPAGGKGGGKAGGGGHAAEDRGSPTPPHLYGHDDELHDKLKNIGSRRPTSNTGEGSGPPPATVELQQQLRAHADAAMALNRKLQEAEQQIVRLKLDKATLEHQITTTRTGGGSPGASAPTTGDKYDVDIQIFRLKQEKAALEQQLASASGSRKGGSAAKAGAGSSRVGATSSSGRSASVARAASASAGKSGGGAAGGAGGGAAGAAKVAELTGEVERLMAEVAMAKREADSKAKEAMDRRLELQKVKEELAQTQTTLDMALQQAAGMKDAVAQEKERADSAAAAAEAAQEGQARAEANAAAANSAAAAALIKRSAATGEMAALLERLEKERDAAAAAVTELRQQVRTLTKDLGARNDEVMQLREELLARQMEKPIASSARAPAEAEAQAPQTPEQAPPAPAAAADTAAAAAAGAGPPAAGAQVPADSAVTAAAVAAMQSLGVQVRAAPTMEQRRRPVSAIGLGGRPTGRSGSGSGGLEGAVSVAAAAAAAAALVPAVLELLRHRVPHMVMNLEKDLETEDTADLAGKAAAAADGGGGAAAAAAATAAAAAAATLRESGNTAAAAAAGATAAAPIIASAFVELVRAELLYGDGGEAATGDATGSTSGPAVAAAAARAHSQRPETIMVGAAPSAQVVSEQLDQLAARGSDRLYVFHSTPSASGALAPETAVAAAAAAAGGVRFVDGAAVGLPPVIGAGPGRPGSVAAALIPGALAATAAAGPPGSAPASASGGAGAVAAATAGPSAAAGLSPVVLDGVTWYPLGVRDAARAGRRAVIVDVPQSPQLPHHTPYFEAAAAAVAAAAATGDMSPQSVVVPVHPTRHSTLASAAVAAAARRRKAAFAQLHSSYFASPAAAAAGATGPPPSPPLGDEAEPGAGAAFDYSAGVPRPPPLAVSPLLEEDEEEEDMDIGTDPDGGTTPGLQAYGGPRTRAVRSAGFYRDSGAADGAATLEAYGNTYVDPELASVLHVDRVSPAAARAAGAGRAAISPEAIGPSVRDRALSALQAPEPLPPPPRPQSAAVRTLEAARQIILTGGGGRQGIFLTARPHSALLPPVAGALPPPPLAAGAAGAGGAPAGSLPQEAPASAPAAAQEGAGPGGSLLPPPHQPGHPGGSPALAATGVKIRAITANPQKGVQLPLRPRGPRHSSGRGIPGARGPDGVRFDDDDAAPTASVTARLVPGLGLAPPMREVQLHTGAPRASAAALHLPAASSVEASREGGDDSAAPELPTTGPELAALARDLMAAQEKAARELEQAMSSRRELAEEVVTSRTQWLEEAKRARALEKELEGVRQALVSMGIGAGPGGTVTVIGPVPGARSGGGSGSP